MSSLFNELVAAAEKLENDLITWRRHLHQHPELSFQEHETAAFVKKELEKLTHVHVQAGEETGCTTGVIALIEGDDEGKSVALRADMDALPIYEQNETDYTSKNEGVMHACGHDAHTTMLLGAAHLLDEMKSEGHLVGKIYFVFQPAEETTDEYGKTGGAYMINSGVYHNVDAAYALHMDPTLTRGSVRLNEGASMANVNIFRGKVTGTGGHGAYPHEGTDPAWMTSFVMQALYGIQARQMPPLEPAVLSIGEIKSEGAENVIPSEVKLGGTFRTYNENTREVYAEKIEEAFKTAEALGGSSEVTIEYGEPALNNDAVAVSVLENSVTSLFSDYQILKEPYGLGGEDFAYVATQLPAAMMFVGAGLEGREQDGLHMPKFDIDETVLKDGAAILAAAAVIETTQNSTT
ncbi:amidohydrolase [Salsuginibacillus halophilus]|uniref:Amidohydrolase n=1 Tax=Salsuginibacillus halophilus TaxID=517424 RepID=A0A2P8HWG8_9BACI|nr:amidohydrolase [Salsuginibacillus halophilus]PSL50576.1 amidohydrolase [Salsuginibacillus halophilus]